MGAERLSGPGGWLVGWPCRLTPLVDLVCFPGAGAGASVFRPWAGRLPGYAALLACQLPGREERIDEAPADDLGGAAAKVVDALAARPESRPLVLYGHSMGAVLAFEVAHRLAGMGRAPSALLISASTPPTGHGGGGMDPQALRDLLLAYDPGNAAILESDELFAALAPVLRADIALLRRHRIIGAPLSPTVQGCLLGGASDPVVPPPAVAQWTSHFAGPVKQATLPGGHHFPFRESQDAVLQRLAAALRRAIGREGAA